MSMHKLKNRRLIQGAVAAILIDVSKKKRIPDWEIPEHTIDLARFLNALDFKWDLDRVEFLTKDTLDKATLILSNAHKIASRVKVANPKKKTLKKLRKDLENISEILKNDQRFDIAFNFAVEVGKIAGRIS